MSANQQENMAQNRRVPVNEKSGNDRNGNEIRLKKKSDKIAHTCTKF